MDSRFLLDTDVFIDCLRDLKPAKEFLRSCFPEVHVSVITVAELFSGMRGKKERLALENALKTCNILDVTKEIAEVAGLFRNEYRKSHDLDLPDVLIAATAQTYGLTMATLNTKHFPMFPKLKAPYKK